MLFRSNTFFTFFFSENLFMYFNPVIDLSSFEGTPASTSLHFLKTIGLSVVSTVLQGSGRLTLYRMLLIRLLDRELRTLDTVRVLPERVAFRVPEQHK